MNFGGALEALKHGKRVTRAGWHGQGMWLVLVLGTMRNALMPGTPYHAALNTVESGQSHVTIRPHIDLYIDGEMQPGWLASQSDMLADDWSVVE